MESSGPSVGQGCLIAIAGAALGFFGCLGGLNLPGSANVEIGAGLIALTVGAAIMGTGLKQMIAAIIKRLRKS